MLASHSALISLVQFSCVDTKPLVYQMMIHFVKTLEQTISNPVANQEKNTEHQNMVLSLLQVIFVRVGDMIDDQTGQLFQKLKQVTEQGLMAYSGLCLGLGKRVNVK
jgi:hypothetical protein